jgi:zinc finger protein-like protein
MYPALEAKVKNVTTQYSIEHEDEEHLLGELSHLLTNAINQSLPESRTATLREFSRKAEAVHTTLAKHLGKEEEQLVPLLLSHFSHKEQAELVAQFLCSIPLTAVQPVLKWLRAMVPLAEQVNLQQAVDAAVVDPRLNQLLVSWLEPITTEGGGGKIDDDGDVNKPATTDDNDNNNDDDNVHMRAQQEGDLLDIEDSEVGTFTCCGGGLNRDGQQQCTNPLGGSNNNISHQQQQQHLSSPSPPPPSSSPGGGGAPLSEILYFHQAIKSALHSFAVEARSLSDNVQQGRHIDASQLTSLVERHRFIRAVIHFHSLSEDQVVFPALKRVLLSQEREKKGVESVVNIPPDTTHNHNHHRNHHHEGGGCEEDHIEENKQIEELGRLLGDIRSCARRGAVPEVSHLLSDLSSIAERLSEAMNRHMAREESDVLPILMTSLCRAQQRHMVWHILMAMPLRLLERVMPWVALKLKEDEVCEWLDNIGGAAPVKEAPLVALLTAWARRRVGNSKNRSFIAAAVIGGGMNNNSDDPSQFSTETCAPSTTAITLATRTATIAMISSMGGDNDKMRNTGDSQHDQRQYVTTSDAVAHLNNNTTTLHGDSRMEVTAAVLDDDDKATVHMGPPLKKIKTKDDSSSSHHHQQRQNQPLPLPTPHQHPGSSSLLLQGQGASPIDHIFQFHRALKRELRELESAAIALQAEADEAEEWRHDSYIAEMDARFQFLQGIYRAHSKAEDEIVFPALESKDSLINVSHSYTLDHRQEELLFEQVGKVVATIRGLAAKGVGGGGDKNNNSSFTVDSRLEQLRGHATQLSRMCAAVRASLETHVRAEEKELWPLFAEHFSVEEQEHLVGLIIGQTGGEVLRSMLSWVRDALTEEEKEAMMLTLKSASKSTAFEQWLGAAFGSTLHTIDGDNEDMDATDIGGATIATTGAGRRKISQQPMNYMEENAAILAEVSDYLAKQRDADQLRYKHGLQQHQGATSHSGHQHSLAAAAGASGTSGIKKSGGSNTALPLLPPPLSSHSLLPSTAPSDPTSVAADSSQFRPGWEDIFRMNQKQLEAAVRRVSADVSLEPQRKAYLIQNIMASKYIVAQQRRMQTHSSRLSSAAATPTTDGGSGSAGGSGGRGGSSRNGAVRASPVWEEEEAAGAPGGSGDKTASITINTANHQQRQQHKYYHDSQHLGCRHYKRKCMLVAPCCKDAHVCRLCHDESVGGSHTMNRYAVSEMVCMECGENQPVAQNCRVCQAEMARYYCAICHLFDDEPGRDIYHCPFCNFCRRGKGLGVDSFHCMDCNACMSLELFNKHQCKEQSLGGNCPVCSEGLFGSKYPIKELPCGHFMHSHCFAAYTRYSYACPVCSKSLGDMSVYWRMIDSLLAGEVASMPVEYRVRRQGVLCNDCGKNSEVAFHFVYHKCPDCGSYNTRVT